MKSINNTGLTHAASQELMDAMVDITGATVVEFSEGPSLNGSRVIWVNVDGVCVLRVCQIKNLSVPSVDSVVQVLTRKLQEMERGGFDSNPTRYLPLGGNSSEVDSWWLGYFQRVMAWQREQAKNMRDLLSILPGVK